MAEAANPSPIGALRRRLIPAALAFLCLLMARALLTRRETISDDAWISMRYARNLVEGHGLLWNPGQEPVEGYSNLLWVLLGAVGVGIGAPMPTWLAILGVGLSMATVPLAYGCARIAGGSRPAALLAATLTAVSSQIAGTALIGLETPSLTLLMTLGTWRALVEEREHRAGRAARPWSALWFGLLSIAHVEGPFYLAIPAIIRGSRLVWPASDAPGPAERRQGWIYAAALLAFPVGQELLRLLYYGDWMPNTIRVKSMGSGAQTSFVLGIRYVLLSLDQNKVLALMLAVGGLGLLPRRGVSSEERLAGFALLLPWLACVAFSIAARGDMINRFRFLAPAVPTLMAAMAVGWSRWVVRAPGPLSLAALCAPLGLGLFAAHRELSIQMVMHNRQSMGVESQGALSRLWDELGQPIGEVQVMPRPLLRLVTGEPRRPVDEVPWFVAWVLENVPPGDTVMFPDVGLLGYALSDANVLDARGLNSRGPMRLLAATPVDGPEGMQDPGVLAFLEEFNQVSPCCLVLQASDGAVWGPPEAALQGAGLLSQYRGVATGRYSSGGARVYTADRPLPSREVVLERYRRMVEALPREYDWASRLAALERGDAQPAEAGLDTTEIPLYPVGSWYREATFPPMGGR